MERVRNRKKEQVFPEEEKVASVMRSLYRTAKEYFAETGLEPKLIVADHYTDGMISQISFVDLDAETAHELADKVRGVRTFAWGHVEAFADNENSHGSWVKLFADLAYPTGR